MTSDIQQLIVASYLNKKRKTFFILYKYYYLANQILRQPVNHRIQDGSFVPSPTPPPFTPTPTPFPTHLPTPTQLPPTEKPSPSQSISLYPSPSISPYPTHTYIPSQSWWPSKTPTPSIPQPTKYPTSDNQSWWTSETGIFTSIIPSTLTSFPFTTNTNYPTPTPYPTGTPDEQPIIYSNSCTTPEDSNYFNFFPTNPGSPKELWNYFSNTILNTYSFKDLLPIPNNYRAYAYSAYAMSGYQMFKITWHNLVTTKKESYYCNIIMCVPGGTPEVEILYVTAIQSNDNASSPSQARQYIVTPDIEIQCSINEPCRISAFYFIPSNLPVPEPTDSI